MKEQTEIINEFLNEFSETSSGEIKILTTFDSKSEQICIKFFSSRIRVSSEECSDFLLQLFSKILRLLSITKITCEIDFLKLESLVEKESEAFSYFMEEVSNKDLKISFLIQDLIAEEYTIKKCSYVDAYDYVILLELPQRLE